MKKLLFLASLLFYGCSQPTHWYTAFACNRDGCQALKGFSKPGDCYGLTDLISELHKKREDKPTKVLFCVDDNGNVVGF